jgi:hypothetical protein
MSEPKQNVSNTNKAENTKLLDRARWHLPLERIESEQQEKRVSSH